jgi:hypothetical protein
LIANNNTNNYYGFQIFQAYNNTVNRYPELFANIETQKRSIVSVAPVEIRQFTNDKSQVPKVKKAIPKNKTNELRNKEKKISLKQKKSINLNSNQEKQKSKIGDICCQVLNQRLHFYEWVQKFKNEGFHEIEWLYRSVSFGREDMYLKVADMGSTNELAAIVIDGLRIVVPTCYLNERSIKGIAINEWFGVSNNGSSYLKIIPAVAYLDNECYEVYRKGLIK